VKFFKASISGEMQVADIYFIFNNEILEMAISVKIR
jgi:hypothetical protein